MRWDRGDTVVLSFLRPDASVGQQHPLRVLADDGNDLLGWLPAGTTIVGSRLADGRDLREAPLAERFVTPRMRIRDQWRDSSTLRLISEHTLASVWWFFAVDGGFTGWYVNLELPLGRDALGPCRIDGVLDLVVHPDLRWEWKDEDEAAEAVRAGRLTEEQLIALRAEGERHIALAESGAFPFDGTWTTFLPEREWSPPVLPPGLLRDL
ncbi:hypothetical protein BAY61_07485 [Prauserella marina]|uniref:DUF402 domain-containing protein n=1 Tax=Prauserella marina TaxID=530584 RepID=A0A222VM55_9PSEU|nr:DUF402 domain-containing protein [Prauserella marina]ASR34843.1 hypothetical protein BAY61_07485 [Prauserella marina]PWV85459.1 uncharacterized protein DUF402 [Prauserella marina]SDC54305.1 Protein of unknown function [Prauserella marina]